MFVEENNHINILSSLDSVYLCGYNDERKDAVNEIADFEIMFMHDDVERCKCADCFLRYMTRKKDEERFKEIESNVQK